MWENLKESVLMIEGISGYKFDESILYIQDIGNKLLNKLYLDKNNGNIYRCVKETDGIINTTEFFEIVSIDSSKKIAMFVLNQDEPLDRYLKNIVEVFNNFDVSVNQGVIHLPGNYYYKVIVSVIIEPINIEPYRNLEYYLFDKNKLNPNSALGYMGVIMELKTATIMVENYGGNITTIIDSSKHPEVVFSGLIEGMFSNRIKFRANSVQFIIERIAPSK